MKVQPRAYSGLSRVIATRRTFTESFVAAASEQAGTLPTDISVVVSSERAGWKPILHCAKASCMVGAGTRSMMPLSRHGLSFRKPTYLIYNWL